MTMLKRGVEHIADAVKDGFSVLGEEVKDAKNLRPTQFLAIMNIKQDEEDVKEMQKEMDEVNLDGFKSSGNKLA